MITPLMTYAIPNIINLIMVISGVFNIDANIYITTLGDNRINKTSYITYNSNNYVIHVNEWYLKEDKLNKETIKLFIHELWHVKQIHDGDLSFDYENKVIKWQGRTYDSRLPIEGRWWETEARRAERKYYKQIKELL